MSDPTELTELLDHATRVAHHAGRVTLAHYQTGVGVERKADHSPVTIADRDAELRARELIERRYPDDGIVGEEHGELRPGARRRWVVDPIDGTRSFIHGVPLYGVLVGVEIEHEPLVGVIHFPALAETVSAARGLGCRWNGRLARVSDVDRIEDALVLTSGTRVPAELSRRSRSLGRLMGDAGTVRTWGDCYGYALVATGRAEVMVDPIMHVWDAAAVRPVIEEAGGVFSDWAGTTSHTAGDAVATNRALADEVRGYLEA